MHSCKTQEGKLPLLDYYESSASSEHTNNANDELVDENTDEDEQHDALDMNDPDIEHESHARPTDAYEVNIEEEEFTGDDAKCHQANG